MLMTEQITPSIKLIYNKMKIPQMIQFIRIIQFIIKRIILGKQ